MPGQDAPVEKRQNERLEILGDLHGEVTVYEDVVVREIGAGGAQVETRAPLQIDSLHGFRLLLGTRAVVVKGRVVHCRISDVDDEAVVYRAGIEFVEVPEPVSIAIRDFLQLLKAVRTGAQ